MGTRLREGDLAAAPAALNLLESRTPDAREQAEALLAEVSPAALGHEPPAHVIGLTGPPGVGKSSLLSRLIREWRDRGRSVAVLAVDPSSRRSALEEVERGGGGGEVTLTKSHPEVAAAGPDAPGQAPTAVSTPSGPPPARRPPPRDRGAPKSSSGSATSSMMSRIIAFRFQSL
ncbi:MAG: hypothetical protein JOY56_16595, partial [Solirubrobacterales bacterium]|nr:hypothetical protein [Solirubrobacterales bacterium]